MNMNSSELYDFIDAGKIWDIILQTENPDQMLVRDALDKALECKGLSRLEAAALLQNSDPELDSQIFSAAKKVKQAIYGNRLVLFAPLYITNECINQCAYCGFNTKNRELDRKTLSETEIKSEVEVLEEQGQKRLLLVYGEHPSLGANWIARTMRCVYDTISSKSGEIRRVNVNCAPLDVEGYRVIAEAGIGTYQCFQETYHRETYSQMHHKGPKTDFLWRLHSLHRAQEAGIDDVAIGALFGLYDYRFDLLGLLTHTKQLERDWGVGPHTISFPRIEPALGSEISFNPPHAITDEQFKKIVAVTRLAVPYTGMIMTTRESSEMRNELLDLGISQMSAASRTYPGAYSDPNYDRPEVQQFCVSDNRSLDEVIRDVLKHGYIPSWCTACYRLGRTGEHFMELAKSGFIQKFCLPNGLMTFKEYLEDYASDETRRVGVEAISKEVELMEDIKRQKLVIDRLARMETGERDLYI